MHKQWSLGTRLAIAAVAIAAVARAAVAIAAVARAAVARAAVAIAALAVVSAFHGSFSQCDIESELIKALQFYLFKVCMSIVWSKRHCEAC